MNQGQKAVLLSNKEWRAHAEVAFRYWIVQCHAWAAIGMGSTHTMEDFRKWAATALRLPEPNHPNCWGAFTSWAKREKLIKWTGRYSVASLKAGKVWKVVV